MKPPFLKTLIALALAAAIIGLTISAAIRRGMDRAMPIAPEEQIAIAISLSNSIYHVNLGYLGLKQVADTIYEYWNRGSQGWHEVAKLTVNFRNPELLNAGVRAAASLEPQAPGYVSDGTLITTHNSGTGQVDYITIAFGLFGTYVQSLFYLYFMLIGLSAFIFILTFRDNVYALAVQLCTLAAYYIERRLAIFDPVAVPTYFGMKHGSTMCLISMWHFVFLVILRRRPTLGVVLGAVVQLAILILAWRIGGATIWVFGFVMLLALASARQHLRLPQFKLLHFRWSLDSIVVAARSTIPFAEDALRWPIVLLLVGLLGSSLYDRVSLHPVYFTDDAMPNRGVWNDAYMGLAAYDPSVLGPRVAEAIKLGVRDKLSWWAARDHMDTIRLIAWDGTLDLSQPAPGLMSEWTGIGMRAALQDRLARGAFMNAVRAHPVPVLKIYLVRKPLHTISTLIKAFTQSVDWVWLSVLVGAGTGAFIMRFSRQDEGRAPRDMILLSGGAVLAATMPSLWGYPSLSTMGDSVLLLAAFAPIAIAMGTAMMLNHRRASSGKASELIRSHCEAKEG
jgi:hypothetical protein